VNHRTCAGAPASLRYLDLKIREFPDGWNSVIPVFFFGASADWFSDRSKVAIRVAAEAYARWVGKELPTEAEWECTARGGLDGAEFVWGDELTPGGSHMANTWQGEFPWENLREDGFERTASVGTFPANGYGLYDMAGNVWEWTTDWYEQHSKTSDPCCASFNPKGGERDKSYDPATPAIKIPRKVMKGGSYLCAPNYCR
jgi:formylglycine-generating enzyme